MWGSTGAIPDPLLQFLQRVVPWDGKFINVHAFGGAPSRGNAPRGGGRAYVDLYAEWGSLQSHVAYLNRIGSDVFFCLSSQTTDDPSKSRMGARRAVRSGANAYQLKALVLDLDVKKGAYPSQRAALAALLPFFDALGLKPGPIVSTGGGLHAYITFDRPVPVAQWLPLAGKLVAAAQHFKLSIDVGVTRDCARLLRLPTSFNHKETGNPRPCRVLDGGVDNTVEAVAAALAPFTGTTPGVHSASSPRLAPLDPAIFPRRPPITNGPDVERVSADLAKIRVRTSIGLLAAACPVVEDSLRRQGDGDIEPLWFELAKLCQYVEGGRDCFHYLSQGDARYDKSQTDHKFDTVHKEGWPACATVAASSPAAAAICQTCVFNGKGQSPIHHAIMGGQGHPVAASATTLPPPSSHVNGVNGVTALAAVQSLTPIWLPQNYHHVNNLIVPVGGGDPIFDTAILDVSLNFKTETGSGDQPFVSIKTLRGTADVDDTNTFEFSTSVLGSATEFAKETMRYGLIARQTERAQDFMVSLVTEMQLRRQARMQRRQGWIEDAQGKLVGFSYGGRVYDANGPGPLGTVEPIYAPRGNLGSWQQAASVFIGKGLIEMEIVIATAFAAPLVRFTSVDGLIVFVRSSQSGEGKTASLETAASVWMSKQGMITDATEAFTMLRLTKLNNLPLLFDEFIKSNDEREARSAIRQILNVSAGKQRGRASRTIKEIPQLVTRSMMVASSNLSLTELAKNSDTNAQAARVLEIEMVNSVRRLNLQQDQVTLYKEAKELNYGTAGAVYAEFLGRHHAFLQQTVADAVGRFQKATGATDGERFWLAAAATIYVGAHVAKALGLLQFDLVAIQRYLIDLIRKQRAAMSDRGTNADDPDVQLQRVVDFINDNLNNRLATDIMPATGRGRCLVKGTVDQRPSEFALRYAVDDKKLWISVAKLKKWCDHPARRYDHRQMYHVLVKAGWCVYNRRGRPLGGGTEYRTGREPIVEFDLTNPAIQHMME